MEMQPRRLQNYIRINYSMSNNSYECVKSTHLLGFFAYLDLTPWRHIKKQLTIPATCIDTRHAFLSCVHKNETMEKVVNLKL